jgi:hypothetical protein
MTSTYELTLACQSSVVVRVVNEPRHSIDSMFMYCCLASDKPYTRSYSIRDWVFAFVVGEFPYRPYHPRFDVQFGEEVGQIPKENDFTLKPCKECCHAHI